ncbi:threonylcarbamoyl-AMP synthase [Luteitalea sp. TBR-22]|uniref:L-threonylcarbamoyladenylate synthase n=1 Tax=Luteitalea sp. TBR-22 TaxID=2802971 RepID=UPI001AF0ADC9|nr:L-threonylcarbamoyladenylate synthase [Luteitalea sp. TBR-22]BCS33787.1 threonylcarbamoyl-AMP synthase [Luteitalea sp. TBR-22]
MVRAEDIHAAVTALRAGHVVGLPTETVYGLAGDASNPAAVARIFAIKGRPATHPVIVHVRDADAARTWTRTWTAAAAALAHRFWPGPLTLVLPKADHVLPQVTGGQDTVALRVPAHPVAQAVLQAFDGGLAAPSANRYGRVSPTTAAHVRADLGEEVALVLDGGPCDVGLESTIVDCTTDLPRVLRPGRITAEEIASAAGGLGEVSGEVPRVPGSVVSHYAPRTPVEIVEPGSLAGAIDAHRTRGEQVAVLAPGAGALSGVSAGIDADADAHAFGRRLYAHLRALDATGADVILVAQPPAGAAWQAVHDRLRRAAAR